VQSFRALLGDLGTLARVRMRSTATGAEFERLATPTPLQAQAFGLLGVAV
jgi:hypothetical protein